MSGAFALTGRLERHSAATIAPHLFAASLNALMRHAPSGFAGLRWVPAAAPPTGIRFNSLFGSMCLAVPGETRRPPCALDAAGWLHQTDPLLQAWEEAVEGLRLIPVALGAPPPDDHGIELRSAERVALQLTMATPLAARFEHAARSRLFGGGWALLPFVLRPVLRGPSIDRDDVARLRPGGAVLLGREGRVSASIRFADGREAMSGAYAHAGHCVQIQQKRCRSMAMDADLGGAAGAARESWAVDLRRAPVHLHVRLPQWTEQAGRIERLMPGDTLTLPPLDAQTTVELMADNLPLARGRLILLGDAVAFLIEQVGIGGGDE